MASMICFQNSEHGALLYESSIEELETYYTCINVAMILTFWGSRVRGPVEFEDKLTVDTRFSVNGRNLGKLPLQNAASLK